MVPLVAGALISGGVQLLSGLFGASAASRRERAAAEKARVAQGKLTFLENNRQDIVNPYENAEDLSSSFSNPMANLSVATQAAEMQAEEADISLANTLDSIRASGASAGGATTLAQAALQSKNQVSANIEQQEAQNEKLKAQGDQRLQDQVTQEKIRMQGLDAAGKQFVFGQQENRDMVQMDRLSAQISGAEQQQMQAGADRTGALTGMIGGLASTAGSYMSAQSTVAANATPDINGFTNASNNLSGFTSPDLNTNIPALNWSNSRG